MLTRRLRALQGATLVILSSSLCSAALAQGADASSDSGGGLDTIIVTAQKTESNLQQTPIAISVIGTEDLKNREIHSLEDLADGGVPSLRVAPFASRSSALTIGIRGIVPSDANQPSRDSGVGTYVDGVYLGRSQGLGAALLDVERIEVLKGPQGTLFGRNAVGGALSIVTRQPSGEFRLTQTIGVRNFEGYSTETHLDLPRAANLSLKFDAVITKRDGTVDNPMGGEEDFDSYDRRGFRAQALWEPASNFSADYAFDISHDGTTPYYMQLISLQPGAPALGPTVKLQTNRANTADVGVPEQESVGKTYGHTLHATWNLTSALELRSITAYRKLTQSQYDDGGAHLLAFRPNGTFSRYSLAGLDQHQFSQEFQLVGAVERLNYVAGAYYYRENGDDFAWTPNTLMWNADGTSYSRLPTPIGGPYPDRASTAFTESLAAFGQATWTAPLLDDRLHFTGGARYTRDRKHGDLTQLKGADPKLGFHFSSNRIDPAATVAFDISPDVNVYGKWGTAYRAGGANSRSYTYRAFGPEKIATEEVGLKSELWDRRARVNLAAYYSRYSALQIDFSNPAFVGSLETVNTNQPATIKGAEADATLRLVSHLTVGASYAYTDTKVPNQVNPYTNIAQPVFIVFTPKNAANGWFDFEMPVSFATLRAHVDASVEDGYHSISSEARKTDKSFTLNARLALAEITLSDTAQLQIALWSKNLTDEQHLVYYSALAGTGLINGYSGFFNEPRTYGVEATVRL